LERSSGRRLCVALCGVVVLSGWAGCGWEEPTGCAYWVGKLRRGEDVQIAMARAAQGACVEARPLMLKRLEDPGLGGDALAALIALGRSDEAEEAVRRSLGDAARVALAAKQVEAWELAEASAELAAALAEPKLASHRGELLQAALAVTEPDAVAGPLVRLATTAGEAAAVRKTAIEALGRVDWAKAGEDVQKSAAALAELAVDPELGDAALAAVGRLPAGVELKSGGLSAAARQGDRRALLLVAALDPTAGREAAVAALTAGPKSGWGSAAPLAVGAGPASFSETLGADEQDPERLWHVLMVVGGAGRERVAAMAADGKGDTRAAAIRGQVLLLSGADLAAWREAAQRHPSALVREVVARPDVQAVAALSEACAGAAACLDKEITDATPKLAGLAALHPQVGGGDARRARRQGGDGGERGADLRGDHPRGGGRGHRLRDDRGAHQPHGERPARHLFGLRSAIERAVPHGRTDNGGRNDRGAWHDVPAAVDEAWASSERGLRGHRGEAPAARRGPERSQLGTLGTGTTSSRCASMRATACGSCCTPGRAAWETASGRTSSRRPGRTWPATTSTCPTRTSRTCRRGPCTSTTTCTPSGGRRSTRG
jgi:hypothetical protein